MSSLRTLSRLALIFTLAFLLISVITPLTVIAEVSIPPIPDKPTEPQQPIKGGGQGSDVIAKRPKRPNIEDIVKKIVSKSEGAEEVLSKAKVLITKAGYTEFEVPKEALDADVKSFTVYLITGDKVSAILKDGKWSIHIKSAIDKRVFLIAPTKNGLFVIPVDVDLKKFDLSLFNIVFLSEYRKFKVDYLPVIVKVSKTSAIRGLIDELTSKAGLEAKSIKTLRIIDALALGIPFIKLKEVYELLSKDDRVIKVVPDRIVKALNVDITRGLPYAPKLYESVYKIGIPSLWSLGINGSGMRIAILDTGIDPTHPDFYIGNESKILAMASFVDWDWDGTPDEPPIDGHGHGTHCAGIAAGSGGYIELIKGVAPAAYILAGKVLSDLGYGYDSWIIAGIEWAVNNSADVISMSLGGMPTISYDPLVDAVKKAVAQGVTVVIAAGNEGPDYFTIASPGVTDEAITVGAIDKDYELAWFTSVGPTPNATLKPDVVAPGVYIASARANNTVMGEPATLYHVYASGTSMSTPHVAGLAALVKQYLVETGLIETIYSALGKDIPISYLVKDIIVSTASELGYEPLREGAGVVNASNIVFLANTSRLIIPHPAKLDMVEFEPIVVGSNITLINPYNTSLNITVVPELVLWSGLTYVPDISGAITVTPANLTLGPYSSYNVTITVNFTKLPTGYHVLKVYFVDSEGVIVGKALVGVSKPGVAMIYGSFAGEPVFLFASVVGYSPILGSPFVSGWDWGWSNIGYGYTVLYPLYPDMVYLVSIAADLPYNETIGLYRAGVYFTLLETTDITQNVYVIDVDFAEIEPTNVSLGEGLEGIIASGYGSRLQVFNATSGEVVAEITSSNLWYGFFLYNETFSLYYLTDEANTTAWGYNVTLSPRYWNVKGEAQGLGVYPNASLPMMVYYRVFNDVLRGKSLELIAENITQTLLLAHGALGNVTVYSECGALNVFGGEADIDVTACVSAPIPSVTTYLADSNAYLYGIGYDSVPLYSDVGYVYIEGYDWLGYELSENLSLYAPLKMPKAMTSWVYATVSKGLDGYNFTYSYVCSHAFRQTITGYYYIYGSPYPFTWSLIINDEVVAGAISYSPITCIEGFSYRTLDNYSYAALHTFANLTFMEPILSFHTLAEMWAEARFIKPNYTAYEIINGFYYGVGVRDIIPYGGYDFVLNYIPPNSSVYLTMLFNTPYPTSNFDLNLSSVKVLLIGPEGTLFYLPILGWDVFGPLHLAVVLVNSTEILMEDKPGAYTLYVEGEYYDITGGDDLLIFNETIHKALYIGLPPYIPPPVPKPKIVYVGPPGSGANYTSIGDAVRESPPGTVIIVLPGEYYEELIVIDKPLAIIGQVGEEGYPTVVAPNGYPIFIVVSQANISSLTLVPYSEASVPRDVPVPLPSEALVPPAAIIVYRGSLYASDLDIEGYPRGITAYEASLTAEKVTAYTDPYYMVDGRRAETLEPSPIYAYRANLLYLAGIASNEIPIVRKTYWRNVNMSEIYVDETPVIIIRNETVSLSIHEYTPAIVLGENVSITGYLEGTLEVVGVNLNMSQLDVGKVFISTASAYVSDVYSYGSVFRVDSAITEIISSSIEGSVIVDNVKTLSIESTSIVATGSIGLLVDTLGAATVSISGCDIGGAELADIYVVLHDADELTFTDNYIHDSFYGLLVLESYTEVAPDLVIENNTFSNVAIPIYIAPAAAPTSPTPYTPYINEYIGEGFYPKTSFSPKIELGDVFGTSQSVISRIYIRYNNITSKSTGIWLSGGFVAPIVLGNEVKSNDLGIRIEGTKYAFIYFNNIEAPNALLVNTTVFTVVNYNNVYGDITVVPYGGGLVDVRYNYIVGNVSVEGEGNVLSEPQYGSEVSKPPTLTPIIPWLNITRVVNVGEPIKNPLIFLNPNPRDVVFDYRLRVSGALEIEGETRLDDVSLTTFGTLEHTAVPDITLTATASGRASLIVDIAVDESVYTIPLPIIIQAPKVTLEVKAPAEVIRGDIFNATISINGTIEGTYTLLIATTKGLGICLDNCQYFTYAYLMEVNLTKGLNEFNVSIIGLRIDEQTITASLAVGYKTYKNSTTVKVLPNPEVNFSIIVTYYPESIEVGYWDSIGVKIKNLVNVPLWLNVTSVSSDPSVIETKFSTIIYVHMNEEVYLSIPIHAVGVGNATVTIIAYDADDNITKSTSVTITVTPTLRYEYKVIGYGYLDTSTPNASATMPYPKRTVWADLLMYIYASQAGISLEKLKNLIEIPWGCVEQTTSPLLAAIEVYRYIEIQGIWAEAAEAMGMTVDELKDLLINDTIRYGVKRLIEHHASHCLEVNSCVLGWYPGLSYDFFYTAYGLLGLIKAYEFQKEYNILVYTDNATLVEVIEKLVRGLAEHQEEDGSWEFNVLSTSMATYALAKALELGFTAYKAPGVEVEALNKSVEWLISRQGADGSWDGHELYTAYALQALAQTRRSGIEVPEDVIVNAITWLDSVKKTTDSLIYWTVYEWWLSDYETTARAVIALAIAKDVVTNTTISDLAYDLAKKGAKYLASKAYEWLRWGNTYVGAQILWAINVLKEPIIFGGVQPATVYLRVYAGGTEVFNASIQVVGETWWGCYLGDLTDVKASTMWCTSYDYILEGNWLAISKNITLNITLEGNATAYWFADTIYAYYPEVGERSSGTSHVPRERSIYLSLGKGGIIVKQLNISEEGNDNGVFEIEKYVEPSIVKPGDIVNVTIRIRSVNETIDYVVVSDTIPEGFELMDMYLPEGVVFDEDFYNETGKLGFAIDHLGTEWIEIKYSLRAPTDVGLGTTITMPAASTKMFYEPEGVDTNTTSNMPTLTIGVISQFISKGVMFGEYTAGVENETVVRWGEVLNLTITTTAVLVSPSIAIEVYNESGYLVLSKEVNGTKALLDTAELKYSEFAGRSAIIVVKLLDRGVEVARYKLVVSLPEISMKDVIDRAKAVVRLWSRYIGYPEMLDIIYDLAKGTIRLWSIALTK